MDPSGVRKQSKTKTFIPLRELCTKSINGNGRAEGEETLGTSVTNRFEYDKDLLQISSLAVRRRHVFDSKCFKGSLQQSLMMSSTECCVVPRLQLFSTNLPSGELGMTLIIIIRTRKKDYDWFSLSFASGLLYTRYANLAFTYTAVQ